MPTPTEDGHAEAGTVPYAEPELLPAVLAVAGCLAVVLDREGRIVFFNQACEALSGYRFEEVKGRPVWDFLLAPEETEEVRAVFRGLKQSGRPNRQEHHWVTKAGEPRSIRWSNTVLTDADGKVEYVIGTGLDVSDHERLETELEEREARLQAILTTALEGIITIDERGLIETVNPAVESIFQYPAEELIGRNVKMLMPPPYRTEHDGYIARYLETGEARIIGIGREVEGLRKNGTIFPLELGVSEVVVRGRRIFTGIVRDISDRRRAEEEARWRLDELAHTSRLLELGEMTTGIAHEVNQPLAAIVTFAQACLRMLNAGNADLEVIKDALTQIASQGGRAGAIIHRLRDLARKGSTERQPVALEATIRAVVELIAHELRHHDIRVKLELADNLPPLEADRVQIEQVLLNLMRNAVEAMHESPESHRWLNLRAERDGDGMVEVTVLDGGKGLPEEANDRVFDTFYSTKPKGMGVGLSISRSIIEAHGGKLWAEPNPGGGAKFHFTLPVPK